MVTEALLTPSDGAADDTSAAKSRPAGRAHRAGRGRVSPLRRDPAVVDHPQPRATPAGLRGGVTGRAGVLAAARSGCCSRSSFAPSPPTATSWWRASGAGVPPSRPASPRSPPSSARPTTTCCCEMRCWRTCTVRTSTRWRKRPPTVSCWPTSAAPRTSWQRGSAGHVPRSPTRCGC